MELSYYTFFDDLGFYSCYRTSRVGTEIEFDVAQLQWKEREQKWDGEERGRTKERESGMESFMLTVCRDSCHGAARSLETLTESSVKRAAPAAGHTVHTVRKHMSLLKCVWARLCEINYAFRNTEESVFILSLCSAYIC